jgi:hypothetical protein
MKPDGKGGMLCSLASLAQSPITQIVHNFNQGTVGKIVSAGRDYGVGAKVTSLDLSGNGLSDLSGLSVLSQYYPNLVRLSLVNNSISDVNQLDHLRGVNLIELFLTGNQLYNGSINEPQNAQMAQYVFIILLTRLEQLFPSSQTYKFSIKYQYQDVNKLVRQHQ